MVCYSEQRVTSRCLGTVVYMEFNVTFAQRDQGEQKSGKSPSNCLPTAAANPLPDTNLPRRRQCMLPLGQVRKPSLGSLQIPRAIHRVPLARNTVPAVEAIHGRRILAALG